MMEQILKNPTMSLTLSIYPVNPLYKEKVKDEIK